MVWAETVQLFLYLIVYTFNLTIVKTLNHFSSLANAVNPPIHRLNGAYLCSLHALMCLQGLWFSPPPPDTCRKGELGEL